MEGDARNGKGSLLGEDIRVADDEDLKQTPAHWEDAIQDLTSKHLQKECRDDKTMGMDHEDGQVELHSWEGHGFMNGLDS